MAKREVTSVRIPADQLVVIRSAAIDEGKSLSTFIRDAAVARALEPAELRRSEEES